MAIFDRTRQYDRDEALNLVEDIKSNGLASEYTEVFYCLSDLAHQEEPEAFRSVVESIVEAESQGKKDSIPDGTRLVTLLGLNDLCIQIDEGRILIGFPTLQPENPGKTYSTFLSLYQGEIDKFLRHK